MEIREEARTGVRVICLRGRLDAQTSPAAEKRFMDLTALGGQRLVFDFSEATFISSGGLALLLKVAKNVQNTDGKLVLAGLSDYIHEVFEIAGFTSIFSIFPTCEEAVTYLEGGTSIEEGLSTPPDSAGDLG
jgi:anti-anti-sigma factor